MAVHAQYPSNYLPFNNNDRNEQVTEDHHMDYSQPPPPPLFFYNGANIANQRKTGRETASFQMVPTPSQAQMNLFSSPSTIQSPPPMNLPQLQVSTGLRLSPFNGLNNNNNKKSQNQEEDLGSLINQTQLEIEQYLITQGEQLRRTLAAKQRSHYRALLAAAEETASRTLKEKDVELNRVAEKTAELETHIARLRTEALTWQAKAMSAQSVAESLHARIAHASKKSDRAGTGSAAAAVVEDSESAFVDPNRVEEWGRTCRVCGGSEVSVVVLPCRHLCLCGSCDAAENGIFCCPVCHAVKSGSVEVRLS